MSSGERQAWKEGRVSKRHAQVLELCAPEDLWDVIAQAVAQADGLGRPGRRNRNFTVDWAQRLLQRSKRDEAEDGVPGRLLQGEGEATGPGAGVVPEPPVPPLSSLG